MKTTQTYLKIHPEDNVLVALKDLPAGTPVAVENKEFVLRDNIAAKHKFFINNMTSGDEVIMYGVLVGKTQTDVPKGGLMTTGNTKHAAGKYAYRGLQQQWQAPDIRRFWHRT